MAKAGARPRLLLFRNLEKHLVVLHHPELVAGALLDGLMTLLQVFDLGGERVVSKFQARILRLMRVQLAVHVPDVSQPPLPSQSGYWMARIRTAKTPARSFI